jgi:hypothetical protein
VEDIHSACYASMAALLLFEPSGIMSQYLNQWSSAWVTSTLGRGTWNHLMVYVKLKKYVCILFRGKHWIIRAVSHRRPRHEDIQFGSAISLSLSLPPTPHYFVCRLWTVCNLNYIPTTLGMQSLKEIASGGTTTRKAEYDWSRWPVPETFAGE